MYINNIRCSYTDVNHTGAASIEEDERGRGYYYESKMCASLFVELCVEQKKEFHDLIKSNQNKTIGENDGKK